MRVLVWFVVIYAVFCLVLFLMQKRMIYLPFRTLDGAPDDRGLPFREARFRTGDGLLLHGWVVEPSVVRASVVFFHGNAGNVSHRLDTLELLHGLGCRVLVFDYRGYGLSEGRPGEEGLYADGAAAVRWFCATCELEPGDLIYHGRSLGGAVALQTALAMPPRALVLESTFTSVAEMGGLLRYVAPIGLLLTERFDSLDKIERLRAPLLVIHSPADEIVPFRHGRRLYEAAVGAERRSFLDIRGDHNGGFLDSGEVYTRGLAGFITAAAGGEAAGPER